MQQQKPSAAEARLAAMQEREKELLLVQSVCNGLLSINNRKELLRIISDNLQEHLAYSQLAIGITDVSEKEYNIFIHTDEKILAEISDIKTPVNEGYFADAMTSADPIIQPLHNTNFKKGTTPLFIEKAIGAGMREMVIFPLHHQKNNPSVLYLFFKRPEMLSRQAIRLLRSLNFQLSLSVSNILRSEKIIIPGTNSTALSVENTIPIAGKSEAIIGYSKAIAHVKYLVQTVAPTTSGVLLLGESGTGKEVIAAAIHETSDRRSKKMIKVNCAALPENLIESELFGHEKGSFTGAVQRKTGKFKLADNSTLFLDEIGELPLQMQTKLLRVLQENEFEPIGSSTTIRVNVRIIAATNRNLVQEVAAGRFRADLFYRLNVFPIEIPPLRERKEDITVLGQHFIDLYCTKNKIKPIKIATKVQEAMQLYTWPGNVRELKHIIERSILLATTGTITKMHFSYVKTAELPYADEYEIKPLQEIEKEYILRAIKLCNGRISGPNGAAIRLGLPHTTLISRMQKLGISKNFIHKK
ncbi:sigma 54-interacting transcriptional regulator [Flavobacterium sp. RHBU_3]|uniref:sigma-54-dependent Fis family transcriptional regulator n=1 Tax=Flavobacterium sp. RHBU_3 TaxID=3391184 RepID=UPI003984DAA4